MISEELKDKIEVTKDLLNNGATEVQFIGEDLKVTKNNFPVLEEFIEKFPQLGSQLVNVNVESTSNLNSNLEFRLSSIQNDLLVKETNLEKITELNNNISILKEELKKSNPNKNKLKKIMKWALEKGWECFIKLAPIVIQKYG